MICPKCKESGVYNEIRGKGFYFCRQCKTEIELESAPSGSEYRVPKAKYQVRGFVYSEKDGMKEIDFGLVDEDDLIAKPNLKDWVAPQNDATEVIEKALGSNEVIPCPMELIDPKLEVSNNETLPKSYAEILRDAP